MDYDDNDITRHNLQLAGEGRSKSCSVLKPYDFPRFDFDDNLQAHLRFDSLVETEVFLGIQSQEDNQWLEDYSRSSNGMEFNSTPAESCSISRQNNVWSEATSSESVEMLLKSVGQEEMMPGESIVPDSNTCGDQSTLAKHLEPGCLPGMTNDEDPTNTESALPQDELLKDQQALKGHVEQQLPVPEEPLAIQANLESVCAKDIGSNVENLEESQTSAEKSMDCVGGEDSSRCAGVVDNTNSNLHRTSVMSEPDASVSHESCNDDGKERLVLTELGQEDMKTLEGLAVEASAHSHAIDTSACFVAESAVLNSPDAAEARVDCVKETADILVKGKPELKSTEGDDRIVSSTTSIQKQKVKILPESTEMAGTLESCRDGSDVGVTEQHSTELGSINSGHHARAEQKMDSSVQLTCRTDDNEIDQAPGSLPKTVAHLLSMDDKKVAIESGDCVDKTNVINSSDILLPSSAAENKDPETFEGIHSNSDIANEEPVAHSPSDVMDDSKQGIGHRYVHRQADFSESEQNIREDVNILSNHGGNVDPENAVAVTNDQTTQYEDVSEGAKENHVAPHANHGTVAAHGDHVENGQRDQAVVVLSQPDNSCEETAGRMVSDVNPVTEVVSISKVEVGTTDDASRPPLSDVPAKSLQSVEKNIDVRSIQFPSIEAVNSFTSNHSQVHSDGGKSSLKESVKSNIGCGGKHEMTMVKVGEEKESAQAADVDKASCGSPTIISSSEPSQTEKDNQEEARGLEAKDLFVKDVKFMSEDLKRKDVPGDDISFTFKVNASPDTTGRERGRRWSPFSNVEKSSSSVVAEETVLSGGAKTPRTKTQKTPRQSARGSDGEHAHGTAKGTSERKGRRVSTKGTVAKENTKKGIQVKDTIQESAKGDKVSNTLLSTSNSGAPAQSGQILPYGHIEQKITKLPGGAGVPDLNTSVLNNTNSCNSLSASFRQPFTDLQQVQLRAQIFVYGSLIQGTAPDENFMMSAFGSSDERSVWESVWRVAVERVRSQKSNSNAVETPLLLQSSARKSDPAIEQSMHSSKVVSSPVARPSSKATSAAVASPIIPLSSPLWSMSTPSHDNLPSSGMQKGPIVDYQHAVTPLHSYQTPPIRNFVGHTSWPSQPCFPSPWLASPQTSTFTSSVRFQQVTMTEPVKLTPVKDSSGPLTSGMKHVTSSPAVQTVGSSPVYVSMAMLPDPKMTPPAEKRSGDSKSRKRKKVPASDPGQVSLISESRTEPVVDANVATIPSSSITVAASASPAPASPASAAVLSNASVDASTGCTIDRLKKGDLGTGKGITCSEETLKKVAEAKCQAEDAAALASAAVNHSEDLWSQLAKQKESGVTSEAEAQLVSAAAAIAAAAAVAKAAAAAAKVACNAAVQAKLMADEAVLSSKTSGLIASSGKFSSHNIQNATPASILKGDSVTYQSSSILVAAKEAAKRRVEAASAAAKQAENLDAIVKAAELAAAAVSQAGKVVAMGEPLSLSDLVEAGPEGYWKLPQSSTEPSEKLRAGDKEQVNAIGLDIPANVSAEISVLKEGIKTLGHNKIHSGEKSNDSLDSNVNLVDSISQSMNTDINAKGSEVPDSTISSRVIPEADTAMRTGGAQDENDELDGALVENSIKKGSTVEVFKHRDGTKSAWYSAIVRTLEDGKAYVCYPDLRSEEGSGDFCEWVSLECERDKAPIIRGAHPVTAVSHATRKRRRAALGDYAWCVGDRVDVWIDYCWWEGVVTEKDEKDETTLKVHFAAQGETSVVRAWNLRTSRYWNNGKWVEWSSSKGQNASSEQSDMPQEKRQKLGSPFVPGKGKDKLANDVASQNPEEPKLLNLSTSDRIFDVGKTTKEDTKRVARRPLRSSQQQKEGSRVVFGVPKPTCKKRKFMEVSNHFPANRSDRSNETNDSAKFTKYLVSQKTTERGWKVPSRNDSREKRAAESRSRVPSSRKPTRTLPQRGNVNSTFVNEDDVGDRRNDIEDSVGNDENTSEKLVGHGFFATEEAIEAPLSSFLSHSVGTSSRKASSSNTKSERLNRGKIGPSSGKLSKIEEDKVYAGNPGKSVQEVTEPRRSNRRIQPTHRLLEGLQSSMIIPKMPSISHDKGQKTQSRILSMRGK